MTVMEKGKKKVGLLIGCGPGAKKPQDGGKHKKNHREMRRDANNNNKKKEVGKFKILSNNELICLFPSQLHILPSLPISFLSGCTPKN